MTTIILRAEPLERGEFDIQELRDSEYPFIRVSKNKYKLGSVTLIVTTFLDSIGFDKECLVVSDYGYHGSNSVINEIKQILAKLKS